MKPYYIVKFSELKLRILKIVWKKYTSLYNNIAIKTSLDYKNSNLKISTYPNTRIFTVTENTFKMVSISNN